jgi:dUTP diphosphatase
MIEINFTKEPGFDDIPAPEYKSDGAAGMDLPAAISGDFVIEAGDAKLVSTGLRMAIPPGYEAQIRPRSGLAIRHSIGILNSPGTIDSDYRGIISVILFNFGKEKFTVKRGDRIAQMVIAPVCRASFLQVEVIDETKRGEGGFGHTGV